MRTTIRSAVLLLVFASLAIAGGINGTVSDGKGKGRSGVTISAKVSGQQISVTTDSAGRYTLTVPASSYGQRARVYANGTYVTTCTIPAGGEYAMVNVTYK